MQINEGNMTGSLVDGMMQCNFVVKSSYFSAEKEILFYGMGK